MSDQVPGAAEVVDAFIAAIEAGDAHAAVAWLAEDCEYDNVPMGKVHGREAVVEILGPMLARCSEIDWPVHRQVAGDTTVFNERTDRFHMAHGWVELPVAGIFEVNDGRITLWRDYFDLPTYREQFPPKEPTGG